MRNTILLTIMVCSCASLLTSQQINLAGRISIHNSKYSTGEIQYVENAQVTAAFTTPDVTDTRGSFSLEFVGLDQGTSVAIGVDKEQLEVVNQRDLQDVVIGRKTPVRIYMATKGQLAASQTEIYKISKEALYAEHNRLIARLKAESGGKDELIADLQAKFNQELKNQYEVNPFLP